MDVERLGLRCRAGASFGSFARSIWGVDISHRSHCSWRDHVPYLYKKIMNHFLFFMRSNLGKLDRILRFALAFWWLGPWAPRFEHPLLNGLIFVLAWIALVESFIGWCWLHTIFGIDTKHQ